MNMALLILMLFSPLLMKILIYLSLILWSFLMWSEWACEMLEDSLKPGGQPIYGLPAMKPVIEFGMIFRVEIAKTKTFIEVFMGVISVYMLFTGRIAPIFPIFFWQFLRIKYLMSSYTQVCLRDIDTKIFKKVVPPFIYKYTIEKLKSAMAYFVTYNNAAS